MTAISLTTAQNMLQFYIDAETAVLKGQTVRHGERLLTRADLEQIRAGRQEWQGIVDGLTAAANNDQRRVRFMDWNAS